MFIAVVSFLVSWTLWTDWRTREIPHWLLAGLLLLWVVAALFRAEDLGVPLVAGAVSGAIGLLTGLVLHAFGWLGAGDCKLLAVVALWLGPWEFSLALLATAVIGLVLCLVALARPTGDFRVRGIPFAWAIAPPAAALLLARAFAT